jgi:predicted metal-dependent hydrolase
MWSNGRSEAALLAAFPVPIEIRSIRGARRMRLRYDEVRGLLKLTCPPRTSRRSALAWALDQRDWIDARVADRLPGVPFVPGAVVPVEGRDRRLVWAEDGPRSVRLSDDALICGGPEQGIPRRVEAFLKRLALETMSREVAEFAAVAGVTPRRVSIGDAATRWGSCSSAGAIRLSWRLILAPPTVRRYVVAHEVAHLRHLDHSAEFKALEARLFGPGLAAAKSELRRLGPRLRLLGRG